MMNLTVPAVPTVPVEALGNLIQINSGGQGTVYKVPNQVVAQSWPAVYKEYSPAARAKLDLAVLRRMVRRIDDLAGGENLTERLAWPAALVERGGTVSGFLMREAPSRFVINLQMPTRVTIALGQVQHLLNDDAVLRDRHLPVHDRWRLEFLRDTADTLDRLHRHGIIVGDLSPKNLLASFHSRPRCFFIDCDAMRLDGESALQQIETPSWEVPQGEELATFASDKYKFALLAIRLFAGDQETRHPSALARVSGYLADLAVRGIGSQQQRPGFDTWYSALDDANESTSTALPWELVVTPGWSAPPVVTLARPVAAPPRPVAAPPRPPGAPGRRRRLVTTVLGVAATGLVSLCLLGYLGSHGDNRANPSGTGTAPVDGAAGRAPVLTGSSPGLTVTSHESNSHALGEAQAIDALLSQEAAMSVKISSVSSDVTSCAVSGATQSSISHIQDTLRRGRQTLTGVYVTHLPYGDVVKSRLDEVLSTSIDIADAYSGWINEAAGGCPSRTTAGYASLTSAMARSATAKADFLQLWNQIAPAYNLAVHDGGSI